MEYILIALSVIVVIGMVLIFNKLNANSNNSSGTEKTMQLLQNQLNALTQMQNEKLDRTLKEMNDRMGETNRTLNDQMGKSQQNILQQFAISQKSAREASDSANKIIQEVTEKLTKLDETNKQVVGFANQLQNLEKILKNPKQRGVLGEYFLESVLKNVLPPGTYQMQYKFSNGEIVDSALFIKDKIVPIDAKFSLENYNRILNEDNEIEKERLEKVFKQDLKNRIEETSKYIRPEEGTMEFAFMFIPSEGLYYDLLINKVGTLKVNTVDLISYAFTQKKVIIVSPTSFLAYLQTVLQGLRALQIEDSAKDIINQVTVLKKHLDAYEENFAKVGKHLGTTVNAYNSSYKSLKQIDKDLFKITGSQMSISASEIDKDGENGGEEITLI